MSRSSEDMTESWNYYFESCRAACNSGATVELPEGHGIVTLDERNEFERVFFSGAPDSVQPGTGRNGIARTEWLGRSLWQAALATQRSGAPR